MGQRIPGTLSAALLLAGLGLALPARADSSHADAAGTTSGPAAGSPTTFGTGGTTAQSPHQATDVRNGAGAAVRREHVQSGGTGAQRVAGPPGDENGKAVKDPAGGR